MVSNKAGRQIGDKKMIDNSLEDLAVIEGIVSVQANALNNGKTQITAKTISGEIIVLKKQSTMTPESVFFYDFRVNGSTNGIGAYGTYGKKPTPYYKDSVIKQFAVTYS